MAKPVTITAQKAVNSNLLQGFWMNIAIFKFTIYVLSDIMLSYWNHSSAGRAFA